MARQPIWDKYEVALLIEAYLRMEENTEPKQKIIAETSQLLRKRAITLGMEIDNVYRNENGIRMRTAAMQYLFTGGKKGIPNDSKLFAEIYDLYKDNRLSFNQLLEIAHNQVDNGDVLCMHLDAINKETENITGKGTVAVAMDMDKCKTDFIHAEFNTDEQDISSRKDMLETKKNVALSKEGISSEIVDFKAYQNYTGSKPFFLSCFGKEIFFIHSWSSVYVAIAKCLYEDYPHIFKALSDDYIAGKSAAIVVSTAEKNRFTRPVSICDSYVLETNRSTENIVRNIKYILDKCNVDYENVVIRFADKQIVRTKIHPVGSMADDIEEKPHAANLVAMKDSHLQQHILEIENVILQADIDGISYDDLQSRTSMSMSEIKRFVAKAKHIVEIKGKLYREDVFIDWNDGVTQMDVIVEKLMKKNNGYISAAQLYDYAHAEMHMFLNDNDLDEERAVYEIAQHLFEKNAYNGKHYTFTGKTHISSSTKVKSNFDVFCKFAEDRGGIVQLADLEEYLSSVGIRIGNIRGQMKIYTEPSFLYYDEGVFIYSKNMGINEVWKANVKTALNKLFADVGDHIILRDIHPIWFRQLPELPGGLHWTPLLLQNILRYYSEELGARTIIAMDGQSIETLHTMLVQNESPIQYFGDVVIAILMENEIPERTFVAETLRQLLVNYHAIKGNELIWNMPKALSSDERFAWDAGGSSVTIKI